MPHIWNVTSDNPNKTPSPSITFVSFRGVLRPLPYGFKLFVGRRLLAGLGRQQQVMSTRVAAAHAGPDSEPMAKRIRASSEEMEEEGPGLVPKRKVFLLFGYRGTGYFGMQRQVSGVPTIEEDLLIALRDTGAITQDMYINPTKAGFQRAARTDKGVHALRQVRSV